MKATEEDVLLSNQKLVCCICNKEILPEDGKPFYIQTKRGSDLYLHRRCGEAEKKNYG